MDGSELNRPILHFYIQAISCYVSSTIQLGLTLIPVKFRNAVLSFDVDGMLNMMRQRASFCFFRHYGWESWERSCGGVKLMRIDSLVGYSNECMMRSSKLLTKF